MTWISFGKNSGLCWTENEHALLGHVVPKTASGWLGIPLAVPEMPRVRYVQPGFLTPCTRLRVTCHAPRGCPHSLVRGRPVSLGSYRTATALAEVFIYLLIREDQEETLPDGHRPATCVAVQNRRLKLLEIFLHRGSRNR